MASAGMLTALALAGLAGAAAQLQQADLQPGRLPAALVVAGLAGGLAIGLTRFSGRAGGAARRPPVPEPGAHADAPTPPEAAAGPGRAAASASALAAARTSAPPDPNASRPFPAAAWAARALALLAVAATLFALGELRTRARLADRLDPALTGQELVVEGRILGLPQAGAAGWRFELAPERATGPDGQALRLPRRLALSWTHWPGEPPPPALRSGERWRLPLRLQPPHGLANPGLPDRELALFEQGIGATGSVRPRQALPQRLAPAGWGIDPLREQLRQALFRHLIGPAADAPPRFLPATAASAPPLRPGEREAGLLAALSLGDQQALDRRDWALYRDTGVAHLMAISGLHITLFAWLAGGLITAGWRRAGRAPLWLPAPLAGAWGGLLAAFLYALLAGWGVPAQRTVLMLAVSTALRASGLRWPAGLGLALAALAVTLADPWALLQPGFWLSFAAVGLLMLGGEPDPALRAAAGLPAGAGLPPAARPPGPLRRSLQALARLAGAGLRTQVRASLGLAPLSLLLFQQVAVFGLLANLLAIPLVTLMLSPLALGGLLWPALWTPAAALAAALNTGLEALQAASGPAGVWTAAAAPAWAAALGLAGGALACAPLPWAVRLLALPLLLPLLAPAPPRLPHGTWRLLAPDVGQGTAVLIRTAHHALLYDAGPRYGPDGDAGERVLLPLLRAEGLRRLDRLVLSHGDADHIGGAASLLAGLPVARLHASLPPDHPLWAAAAARGAVLQACRAGQRWQWDGVEFAVLHPDEAAAADPALPSNARSCVLRVQGAWPERPGGPPQPQRLLLTGDIGRAEELRLAGVGAVQAPAEPLRAEWLVLAHHGSRHGSQAAFLDVLQPRQALAQAGHRNPFGHPAPEVRQRLAERGIPLVESARCGAWRAGPAGSSCWRQQARRVWHPRGAAAVPGSALAPRPAPVPGEAPDAPDADARPAP